MYGGDLIAGSTLRPRLAHAVETDAVPQIPLVGTAISTVAPAASETTAERTCTRCETLLSCAASSMNARKTGTGSHASTRQPSFAASSA